MQTSWLGGLFLCAPPRVKSKLIASYFLSFSRSFSSILFYSEFLIWIFVFLPIFVVLCIQQLLFILDIYRQWWNAFSSVPFDLYYFPVSHSQIVYTTHMKHYLQWTFNFCFIPNFNVRQRSVFIRILSPDVCILCAPNKFKGNSFLTSSKSKILESKRYTHTKKYEL